MKLMETINQGICTYRVYQYGNRSFYLKWINRLDNPNREVTYEKVLPTVEACRKVISGYKFMDELFAK